MRFAIICDAFPPLKTSAAIQIRDLATQLVRNGHKITILVPDQFICTAFVIEDLNGVKVIRLKSPKIKDLNYIKRTFNEFIMPFIMINQLKKTKISTKNWDGIIWYSPSIFFAPLIHYLKKTSNCKSYLILRDIFPEWALDLGLLKIGIPYFFLKIIQKYQYYVADVIGIQSPGNYIYLRFFFNKKIEVLYNWLDKSQNKKSSISVMNSRLFGRIIFIYAGNMGIAQGIDIFLLLAERLISRNDIGFLFIGRGGDSEHVQRMIYNKNLSNTLFFDEIDPDEISSLYSQCHAGIISLDIRHRTHNIPGKFLSYMQSGLPVLAKINPNNDLVKIIINEMVGKVSVDEKIESLINATLELVDEIKKDTPYKIRCETLSNKLFSPKVAAHQIEKSFIKIAE